MGYDVVVYIDHEANVFAHVELDGTSLDHKVINVIQAKWYIEDLIFEREGFLFGDSNFRISEDEFRKFENTPEIKHLCIYSVDGKEMTFLGNQKEIGVVGNYLNRDIEENCSDYFRVYCGSRL